MSQDLQWRLNIRASAELSNLTDDQIAALDEFKRFSSFLPGDQQVNAADATLDEEDFFVQRLLSRKQNGDENQPDQEDGEEDEEDYEEEYEATGEAYGETYEETYGDAHDQMQGETYSSGNEMLDDSEEEETVLQLGGGEPQGHGSPKGTRLMPAEPSDFRNSMVKASFRSTATPEELRRRTLSVLVPGGTTSTIEPKILHHSKKYEVRLFMKNDTSKNKYLLDVSAQGLRIRTKEKVLVRFFDLQFLESIRLRKLPNGDHIMEIDFLRENPTESQDKYGRVILLTDQGKAIVKELNTYKPKRQRLQQKESKDKEKREKKERKEREKEKEKAKEKPRKGSKKDLHLIFGVPLAAALAASSTKLYLAHEDVPAVVRRSIDFIEERALQDEGIYRLSGSASMIKFLKDKFDAAEDFDIKNTDADPQSVASVLKQYLRDLPESVFTEKLESQFAAIGEIPNVEERVHRLTALVRQLPLPNYALLNVLMGHLRLIESHNNENKMTIRNLGIVFVPTLRVASAVFTLLITHHESIFVVDPSLLGL